MRLPKIILTLLFILIGFDARSQTAVADSLRQVVAHHSYDTIGIKALIRLATEVGRHDAVKVKEYAFQGLRLAQLLKTHFGVSANYSHLTTYYSNAAMPDSALFYLNKMKLLAEANPEDTDIVSNYYLTAGLFYKNKGQFDVALLHMLKALDYMAAAKYQLSRAGQLLNIGNTYNHLGNLQMAAKYHLKALKQFEALDNKRGQSFCLQSLGADFLKLKDYASSLEYYKKSLVLKKALNDQRGFISTWTGLGSVYTELGQYKEARLYLQKALKQAQALNLTQDEVNALYEIGLLQLKMKQNARARITFQKGLPLARQRGDSLMSAKFNAQLAALQQESLREHELGKTLSQKLHTAQQAGDRAAEADAYLKLAEWHTTREQFEQAFEFLKKHYQLKDSVVGKRVLVQLKQLEEQYQQEKHRKEILFLKKDQELKEVMISRQLANQKMIVIVFISFIIIALLLLKYYRTINRTKRTIAIERLRNSIARDLHDDIGSTLSSIHINSQLAMAGNTPGSQRHLQRISDSAAHMMESMDDIIWSINPGNDTLEKIVARMKEFAAEILEPKNISYSFQICDEPDKTKISLETRKNLYLIFKESINNAAKYSEGSAVVIAINLQNNSLHLSVRDNGKGFESTSVRQGNGLFNMEERARILRGKLFRRSIPGQGTEIIAELPIT